MNWKICIHAFLTDKLIAPLRRLIRFDNVVDRIQFLVLASCAALGLYGVIIPTYANELTATSARYMVAAADPRAVEAGLAILQNGGSAVDAAITVQLVLNLVEPQSSGIGGGAFMLHYDAASQKVNAYDGRETAPDSATEDLFLTADGQPMQFFDAVVGGRAVGTPGVVAMMALAHSKHGKLPWNELFDPAIELANDGFTVSERLAAMVSSRFGKYLDTFSSTRDYFFPNGKAIKEGQILKNPAFAKTLSTIAEHGPKALYRGKLATAIVDSVQNAPHANGLLSLSDLDGYAAKTREPVCYPYRNYRICGMGPPSSGALTTGQILGIVETFDLPLLGAHSATAWHLITEASKLAFADRNQFIADTDFIDTNLDWLLDRDYLRARAELIKPHEALKTPVSAGGPCTVTPQGCVPDQAEKRSGTSHISIIDGDGNAVSMTTTIEGPFGSFLMVGGFLLNNQLTDFSFVPRRNGVAVANRVEPGKRPRSSTSPTLVFDSDGALRLVIGSPGGSRIIGYVAKTLIAVLDWGLDVQSAIDLGNIVNRNAVTEIEQNTPMELLQPELEQLGHEVKIRKLTSGLHGIEIVNGVITGGADPRREGIALGR